MEPFDKHQARPSRLYGRQREFMDRAREVVDVEAVSDAAFDPAVASWDGLASAELRASPKPVRMLAHGVAAELAWAATAIGGWARQVTAFNTKVDKLRQEREQLPAEVERRLRLFEMPGLLPGAEDARRERLRAELLKELYRRWELAHHEHIDEGGRAVAALLNRGPTWDNLETARRLGGLPDVASPLLRFFAHEWELTAGPAEALRLAGLLRDPSYRPTEAELEQFRDLLERFAGNQEFWYHFLSGLGQEGLLLLNGNLALQAPDYFANGQWDTLQQLAGEVQTLLGEGLALATAERGEYTSDGYVPAEYELDARWLAGLTLAGQEVYVLGGPGTNYPNAEIPLYGYQLLGPLLKHGEYDARFLSIVGGDLVDFEIARGGSDFWMENVGLGSDSFHMRLDWATGGGNPQSAGFDPMDGLTVAMRRNPEGALELLYGHREDGTGTWSDGSPKSADGISPPPSGYRLPRLDYLLTDREWPADWVNTAEHHLRPPPDELDELMYRPALQRFGEVLVEVGRLEDERAPVVVELVVYELATDERAMGYPNGTVPGDGRSVLPLEQNLMPPALREPIGTLMADYIADVNRNSHPSPLPAVHPFDRDASFSEVHLVRVLADLGKDQAAYEQVATAQSLFTSYAYDYALSSGEGPFNPAGDARLKALEEVAAKAGQVMGALDTGAETTAWYESWQADQAANYDVEFGAMMASHLAHAGAEVSTASRVPVVGYAFTVLVDEVLEQIVESTTVENRGQASYLAAETVGGSRTAAADLVEAALYRSGNLPNLPEPLDGPESPDSMAEWTDEHHRAWEEYLTNPDLGAGIVSSAARAAADGYQNGRALADSIFPEPPPGLRG